MTRVKRKPILLITGLVATASACVPVPDGPWPPLGEMEIPIQEYKPDRPSFVVTSWTSDDVLVVADEFGTYKSGDAGARWLRLDLPTQSPVVAIGGTSHGEELVMITKKSQLLKSMDGGTSWTLESLLDQLPGLDREKVKEWHEDELRRAEIANEGEDLLIVGYCHAFLSRDGAVSWNAVTGIHQPESADHYRCIGEIVLDESFTPRYAEVHVDDRGKMSAEYIFEFTKDEWQELCSFDSITIMDKTVAQCDEVREMRRHPVLDPSGALDFSLKPLLADADDAIFHRHHLPLPEGFEPWLGGATFSNAAGDIWYVDERGVAVTRNRGESWETRLGGVWIDAEPKTLGDGSFVTRRGRHVYRSPDAHVWELDRSIQNARDLIVSGGVALVANDTGISRITLHASPAVPVFHSPVSVFASWPEIIWAYDDQSLAASGDHGETWVSEPGPGEYWHCRNRCIQLDDFGRLWEARFVAGELTVSSVGRLPVDGFPDDAYFDNVWFAEDHGLLLAAVQDTKHDDQLVYVSVDRGRTWVHTPPHRLSVDYLLFTDADTALIVDDVARRLYWIHNGAFRREPSPSPTEVYDACSPEPGHIYLETDGVHPNWPLEEQTYWILSTDNGASWSTMKSNYGFCSE